MTTLYVGKKLKLGKCISGMGGRKAMTEEEMEGAQEEE